MGNNLKRITCSLVAILILFSVPFMAIESLSVNADTEQAVEAAKKRVIFNANKGKVSKKEKKVTKGKTYGSLPTPKRSGYGFLGWYTKKTGGTKITSSTKVTNNKKRTLYAHWGKNYTIKFSGNGGSVSTGKKTVTRGKKYGSLPTPKREGYVFEGWYTQKKSGKRVTKSTVVNTKKNRTLYAHWKKQTWVACVGASIVYGSGLSNRSTNSYPAQLQSSLGKYYNVKNFGASGTTIGLSTGKSYIDTDKFLSSYSFNADKIFILLGTNDSKKSFWKKYLAENIVESSNEDNGDTPADDTPYELMAKEFISDYKILLRLYNKTTKNSDIYIMTLPDILNEGTNGESRYTKLIEYFNLELTDLAESGGYGLVDVNSSFKGQTGYYASDGIHTTKAGAKKIADLAYKTIK